MARRSPRPSCPQSALRLTTRSGAKKKLYLAELCKVAEVAEVKDVYNDATYYEVTWDVFRDASGNFLVELRDDGVLVSGS